MKRRKQNLFMGGSCGCFLPVLGKRSLGGGDGGDRRSGRPYQYFLSRRKKTMRKPFRSEDPKEAAEAFLRGFYTIGFSEAEFFLDAFLEEQKQIVLEAEEKQTEQTGEQDDSDGEESSEELEVSVIGEGVEEPYVLSYDSVLGAIREISPYEYMTEEAWEGEGTGPPTGAPPRLYGTGPGCRRGSDGRGNHSGGRRPGRKKRFVYSFEVSVEGAGEENGFFNFRADGSDPGNRRRMDGGSAFMRRR